MNEGSRRSRITIYPAYFDANLTRREGRRVPLHIAVPDPSIESILSACRVLDLNPVVEEEKAYSRSADKKGRVIVDKRGSKLKTIYMIANELKKQQKR